MRIVIAEDSFVVRAGLIEVLLDRGHEVSAATDDADALLAAVAEHEPAVAIIDVRLPPTHTDEGVRAAIRLRADHPGVGILVFSQYIDTTYASELLAMCSGGIGYLLKDKVTDLREFIDAVERVASGGTALDPEVVRQLVGASRHQDRIALLSAREREVMTLVAQGRSNTAISRMLTITDSTVEKHIASIFTKLDLHETSDGNRRVLAVLWFLEDGSIAHGD